MYQKLHFAMYFTAEGIGRGDLGSVALPVSEPVTSSTTKGRPGIPGQPAQKRLTQESKKARKKDIGMQRYRRILVGYVKVFYRVLVFLMLLYCFHV
jgi:hypothetical protein